MSVGDHHHQGRVVFIQRPRLTQSVDGLAHRIEQRRAAIGPVISRFQLADPVDGGVFHHRRDLLVEGQHRESCIGLLARLLGDPLDGLVEGLPGLLPDDVHGTTAIQDEGDARLTQGSLAGVLAV